MKKLLLIEDEACTRNLFSSCLASEGYQVTVAADGLIGLQEAQKQMPDLVICDVLMPNLDGHSVLSAFRQNTVMAEIPFVFLTASIAKAEFPHSAGVGQDSYLAKPATVDELLDAIALQLERQLDKTPSLEPPSTDRLADRRFSTGNPANPKSIFPEIEQLNDVFAFIEAHYDQPISLSDVAQAVGYSPAYLTSLVGSRSGLTISRWITERRMVEVRSLLQYSDFSIDQIAAKVGYANVRHLFRQFRQYHNMTPQMWRKQHRTENVMALQA
ncbi:MAG: response regulator [Oculatellaceae cyanobacterium Prado106]|jgi:YesN/AraC family two-component response regulator|nr:response regulator [Oculatellaceae cyanobacterium Prado106]